MSGRQARGSLILFAVAAVLTGLSIGAVASPPAQAKIIVGKGAAGVQLGFTKAQVINVLGKPLRKEPGFWAYAKPCLCTLDWRHQRVRSIDTLSKTQRTNKGIGPGSSLKATTAAYPEAKCFHPEVFGETSRKCVVRSPNGARTVFAFFEEDLPMRDVEIWR
jgi:hypothetical protein